MPNKKVYIDTSLTPKNAQLKGYVYIGDIIYDINMPNNALIDILELINKNGYKLGTPAQANQIDPYFGLYKPLDDNNMQ